MSIAKSNNNNNKHFRKIKKQKRKKREIEKSSLLYFLNYITVKYFKVRMYSPKSLTY